MKSTKNSWNWSPAAIILIGPRRLSRNIYGPHRGDQWAAVRGDKARVHGCSFAFHSFIFVGAIPMRGRDSIRIKRAAVNSRKARVSGESRLLGRIGQEYGLALRFERLEERCVLSAVATTYFPHSQFLFNDGGFLSPPSSGNPLDIALSYVNAHASDLGLTASDLATPFVTDFYSDNDTGIGHVYLRQQVNGLEVDSADLSVTVTASGQVLSVGGGFVPGLNTSAGPNTYASMPDIGPLEAVERAAHELNISLTSEPIIVNSAGGPDQATTVSAPDLSLDDIPARLHYVPTQDGQAILAWQLIVRTPNGDNWFDLSIAATRASQSQYGSLVSLNDWVEHATYNFIPPPNESPQDGGFAIVTDPADATASPFGWHDTNGVVGAEFTDTRGNNVDAPLDRDANNVPDPSPPRPDGGASLDFSGFTFDPLQQPTVLQNQNVAQENLFVLNNIIHDIHYKYGFTEAAGNFQVNNYGRGGVGNDAVQADAQDGAGTNNANFATPPDGSAPRMQMFLFTSTTPQRDGDLDNDIIIHEYGHGVSNRLTGGPSNSNALTALQSGGMGEGWSDWDALMFLQRPTDTQNGGYGMGTYVLGQPPTGTGIRTYKYSYDMSVDPHTFNDFGAISTEVHYAGEIWASTLWDMNWLLINKLGYDSDIYTGYTGSGAGGAGNKLALQLVMDAMKLQPANPSFINARDAILAADDALRGGADRCEVWTVFARRGLGQFASTASSSASFVSTSFAVPASACNPVVINTDPAVNSTVFSVPSDYVVNFSDPINLATVDAGDFTVTDDTNTPLAADSFVVNTPAQVTFHYNSAPFSTQGQHTMAMAAGSVLRASDSMPLDAFSGSFGYDGLLMQVASTVPPVGSLVTLPLTSLDVNFNEAYDPASIGIDDLSLSQGTVTGFSLLDADTVRYTLSGLASDGPWQVTMAAGAVTDAFGFANASFSGDYDLDVGTVAYPTPLVARPPLGSLIYDPSVAGSIGISGDTDSYTLAVD